MKPGTITILCQALALVAVILAGADGASARRLHRIARVGSARFAAPAPVHGRAADAPSSAQAIERAAARQQAAPGVTRAIDEGAASSATGGPVGGLPGNAPGP